MLNKNYLIYGTIGFLTVYLIGVFSGLFRYLGKYFLFFDNQINNFFYNLQTPFLNGFFNVFTLFGGVKGLVGFGIIVFGVFLLYKKRNFLIPFIIGILGTEVFVLLGKVFTGRIRPTGEEYSFPSNHAAISLIFYGFIFLVIKNQKTYKKDYLLKITNISLIIVILLVGISRLYLGVHFLSDVLMGYTIALLWLIISINIYNKRNISNQ